MAPGPVARERRRPPRGSVPPKTRHDQHAGPGTRLAAPKGQEWLYGRNAVRESLRARRRGFRRILVARGSTRSGVVQEILTKAQELSLPVDEVERAEIDDIAGGANHQGVCLLASQYPYLPLIELLRDLQHAFVLVLDSLQDPQNLGTVLRTAEAVSVTGIIMPEHRAAEITPAVVNASAGAVEHLRVAQVVNLARTLEELKDAGIWVVGIEATPDAQSLWATRLDGPLALVLGSEGEGIRRLVLEKCDVVARLPLLGKVESLNAAVAAAVALYEVVRRRA